MTFKIDLQFDTHESDPLCKLVDEIANLLHGTTYGITIAQDGSCYRHYSFTSEASRNFFAKIIDDGTASICVPFENV